MHTIMDQLCYRRNVIALLLLSSSFGFARLQALPIEIAVWCMLHVFSGEGLRLCLIERAESRSILASNGGAQYIL